jgi:hypothetical protein
MSNEKRCTLCDMSELAKTEPEGAVALTLMLGCASGGDLDGFKRLMCQHHRARWPLLLLTGGARLEKTR